MIKKNIAVLGGGNSSEFSVSIESAGNVKAWIDSNLFNVFLVIVSGSDWYVSLTNGQQVSIDKNDFSFSLKNTKIKFDCAVMAIHGTPGEDGILQSYFELINLPYTTCDVFVSALTFDKYACKVFLREHGINMAKEYLVYKHQLPNINAIENEIGFPCFVKPNTSGSSCGVSKVVNRTELNDAISNAFLESDLVIIENALDGTEISHGVAIINNAEYNFPLTEIISKSSFFDYQAKYDGDKSEEITPARLPEEVTKKCQALSMKIYKALRCRGIVRVDYILVNEEPYFLEVNTVPGMSSNSIVPKQIRAMNKNVSDFYTMLINESLERQANLQKERLHATSSSKVANS